MLLFATQNSAGIIRGLTLGWSGYNLSHLGCFETSFSRERRRVPAE